jgi:hypothetical protein
MIIYIVDDLGYIYGIYIDAMELIVKEEACNVSKGAAYVHLLQRRASSAALY